MLSQMNKITRFALKFLSVLLIFTLMLGITAEPISAGIKDFRNIRPTLSHPVAVQHGAGFVYSKDPLLRMPDIAYEASEPYEQEYGAPVEEGEYESIYQTGENSYKTVVDTVPNNFFDENGELIPIDNTLMVETAADGSEILTNTANALNIELPVAIAQGDGVSASLGNDKVCLIPLNGDYSRAAAQGDSVLYNDVYPNIDVQYTAHEVALKEFIILRVPVEQNTFQYRLEAPGLDVRLENGAIVLYHPGEDFPVFIISAPVMFDAAGEHSFDVGITLEGDVITVWADAEWLADPARVYPVEIDPSVVETKRATASMLTVAQNFYQDSVGYSMAGYIQKDTVGYPGDPNWGIARAMFYFDGALAGIPTDAVIDEARFVLNQYGSVGGSGNSFDVLQLDSPASYADIDAHPGYSNHWDYVTDIKFHWLGSFTSGVASHVTDVTDTVSNWLAGAEENYGLMVKASNHGNEPAALFYKPGVSSEETKPRLEIDWRPSGSVPPNYGLDATTVNVRPVAESGAGGQLDFYGVFWDGIATPDSDVTYAINTASGASYGAQTAAGLMPDYPNSSAFELLPDYPQSGSKYRRKISNWQTDTPFTAWQTDVLYTLNVYAEKGGVQGALVESESFLIYKVKQFDTLTSIANWYGVPYKTIAYDNHIVDRLLVEGNTVFVRNPQKNADTPYNPPEQTDDAKREIDNLLMGRGLHCEFGYEPINLNTGNFLFEAIDVSAEDFGGAFTIERFYNSVGAGKNSLFGRGWAFNWDEKLSALADGTLVYSRADGSALRFKLVGSSYIGPDGYGLALERIFIESKTVNFGTEEDPNEITSDVFEYKIYATNGTVKTFNSFGLLVESQDIDGFKTTLEYDADFKLTSIVAPSGLTYAITTDTIGRIAGISLPDGNQIHYVYDTAGDLITFVDANGNETNYNYDAKHHMTSWADANGTEIIKNEYDADGRVVKQTDARGEVVSFAYAQGKTSITDMRGFTTVYHYDSQYRTTKIEYSDGTSTEKGYDSNNRLSFEINQLGQKTEYSYDTADNTTKILRHDGAAQLFEYDSQNRQTKFTNWDGAVTQNIYSAGGDLVKIVFPDGSENTFTYDTQHRMLTQTDALGNTTKHEWDGALQSAVIDPLGNKTEYNYDALGRQTSVVDAAGGVSRITYDEAGRVTAEQDADGNTKQYIYDDAGLCIAIVDQRGYRTDFKYDKMNNLIEIVDALGVVYKFTYDEAGNQKSEDGELGRSVGKTYDEFGRLATQTGLDGGVTKYTYDALGRLITETNPLGGVVSFEYDPATGQVSKNTDAMGGTTLIEYDVMGSVVKSTDALGGVETYTYDIMGRVKTHTDKLGLTTTNYYDAAGQVVKTEDTLGRKNLQEYDATGRLTKTTSPDGASTKTEYDKLGRAVATVNALGHRSEKTYSNTGKLLSETDALGGTVTHEYDACGNKTKTTDVRGFTHESEYDPMGRLVLQRDALGGEIQTEYDAAGNPYIVRDVFGAETLYEFSDKGLPTKITDALGNASFYEYDKWGVLIKTTAANGTISTKEYDNAGRLAKETSATGLVTTYTYDIAGNLLKQRDSLGEETTNTYNSAGLLIKTTNAVGQTETYEYDIAGREVKTIGFDGLVSLTEYDIAGRISKAIDGQGNTTSYTYNKLGQKIKSEDSFGRVWIYTYDALGRQVSTTGPLGDVSSTEYDAGGNTLKEIDALGGETSYVYDALNRVTETTDANGNKALTTYDAASRTVKTQNPDGGLLEYEYDAVGNVAKEMDALGNITKYTYNEVGAVLSMETQDGHVFVYTYDWANNSYSMQDANGHTSSIVADAKGRTVKEIAADGGVSHTQYDKIGRISAVVTVLGGGSAHVYNERGNLVSTQDSLGRKTTYEYDDENQLVCETNPAGGKTTYTYNAMGEQTSVTSPGGSATKYTYDLLGRVLTETDALGGMASFEYDALGRQTQITEPNGGVTKTSFDALGNVTKTEDALGQAHTYKYDAMNRLVAETDPMGGKTSYDFDKNGQLLKETDALGKKTTYNYDKSGNLITDEDAGGMGAEYVYDGMGNLVSVKDGINAVFTYTYDKMGRLASRKDQDGNTWEYSYDYMGNVLTAKDPLGNTQKYVYDKENRLIKSVAANNEAITYEYDLIDNLAAKKYSTGQADAQYQYNGDSLLVRMRDVSGESSFAYDALGRLIISTNAQGDVVKYEYSKAGDLAAIVYPDGSRVAYAHNLVHQLASVAGRDGAKLDYAYNAKGEVTQEKRGDGSTTLTEYDAIGRVTKLQNIAADGGLVSEFLYEYNNSGDMSKEIATLNKEVVTKTYTYTGRGQLASVRENGGANGGANWSYKYDTAGNRAWEEIVTADGTRTVSHSYDKAGRIASSTDSKFGKTTYEYDASGNIISENGASGNKTYEYTQENLLAIARQEGTVVMAAMYDGLGNRVYQLSRVPASQGAYLTEEDVWQRVPTGTGSEPEEDPSVSSETPDSSSDVSLPPEVVPPEAGGEESLFWYGFWQGMYRFSAGTNQALAAERGDWLCQNWPDSPAVEAGEEDWGEPLPAPAEEDVLEDIGLDEEETEKITENKPYKWVKKTKTTETPSSYWLAYSGSWYVHDLTSEHVQVLAEENKNGITDIYTYGLRRLTHEKPGKAASYVYDGRGSVVQNVQGGGVASTLKYDPYGKLLEGGETLAPFFGYNGEEHNPETGLQYLRARYYFAEIAAFTTLDTVGGELHQPLTQNLYLYVSGNPVNYVDPSGHSWLSNAWNTVVSVAKSAAKAVSSAVSKVVSTVKNVVNNVIAPAVANVANAVKNTISKAVSHVVNGVQKVIDSIDDAINGAPSSSSKGGESILHPTLDMDVKTLIERNREFCSAETKLASPTRLLPPDYSKPIDLGNGWWARVEQHGPPPKFHRHVHIYKGGERYSQNNDGSPNDEGGNPPSKPKAKFKAHKLGWDWDAKAKEWAEKTKFEAISDTVFQYTFADGKVLYEYYNQHAINMTKTVEQLQEMYLNFANGEIINAPVGGSANGAPPVYVPAPNMPVPVPVAPYDFFWWYYFFGFGFGF